MGEFSINGTTNRNLDPERNILPFKPLNRLPFSSISTICNHEVAFLFQHLQTPQFDIWFSEYRAEKPVMIYATVENPLLELTFIQQEEMNYRMEGLGDIRMPGSSFNFSHEPYVENRLFLNKGRSITFDIHVKESYLQSLCESLPALERFVNDIAKRKFSLLSSTPRPISICLQSMIITVLHAGDDGLTGIDWLETHLENMVLKAISELTNQHPVPLRAPRHQTDAVLALKQYLTMHYDEHIRIPKLAKKFAINECTMKRLFRQQFGVSIYEYVLEKRIEKAKELLVTSKMPIREMSFFLGWQNPNCLTEVFKRETNMTPIDYRLRS